MIEKSHLWSGLLLLPNLLIILGNKTECTTYTHHDVDYLERCQIEKNVQFSYVLSININIIITKDRNWLLAKECAWNEFENVSYHGMERKTSFYSWIQCELSIGHSVPWSSVFQIWLLQISKPDSILPDL